MEDTRELVTAEQLYEEIGRVGNQLHSLVHKLGPLMTCETHQRQESSQVVFRFNKVKDAQEFHALLVKFFSLPS